jgi:hypothetical protein
MHYFKLLWCLLTLCFIGASDPQGIAKIDRQTPPSQTSARSFIWKDRRPIGTLFLGNSPAYTPNNPRMWLNAKDLNLSTAQGKQEFRKRMMEMAGSTVGYLKSINAQGVIIFDVEGTEAPHPDYTWVGDPRLLKERAPEMDEIADEFFKKFRDANLRVGVTIRAQFMFPYKAPLPPQWWKTDKDTSRYWSYKTKEDAVKGISERIAYAKQRWGATLFYVDSNNEKWVDVIAKVQQKFPDVLIIPEHTANNPAYLDFSAPLERVDYWKHETSPEYRKGRTDGFKAILIRDPKKFEQKYKVSLYDYLLPKVRAGDLLMINVWYPDPRQEVVRKVYRDVYGQHCCTWNAGRQRL